MSYCVNCGVELHKSLERCPMCNTKVINPNELESVLENATENVMDNVSPYPENMGVVEQVKRKDIAILITSILLSIAVTCGLLNRISFSSVPWSLVIIGACMVLWVILIPVMIHTKQSPFVSVLYDGAVTLVYLFLISQLTTNNDWLIGLGIPITIAVTAVAEAVVLCYRKLPKFFLFRALYLITGIGILCGTIEAIIDWYMDVQIMLSWAAVVLTVCTIADIILITVLSRKRLRNALRKRLHF